MPKLIALIGPAGSGKTTLACQLSTFRNYVRKPFAAGLKGMLANFLQNQGADRVTIDRMLNGDLKEQPTEYLSNRTPRHAMQTLGTEWREMIDRNLWVDAWERDVWKMWERSDWNVVVDDMRFQHEADRVRRMNGVIVRITRPGSAFHWAHISEQENLKITSDYTILNRRTPSDMLREFMVQIGED